MHFEGNRRAATFYVFQVRAICNIFVLGCGNPDNGANRLSVVHAKVDISREIRELDPVRLLKAMLASFTHSYMLCEWSIFTFLQKTSLVHPNCFLDVILAHVLYT